jgi:hypothetical protein
VPLHLTKVAVGCASLEALQNRIARRVSGNLVGSARMRQRAEELPAAHSTDRQAPHHRPVQILRLETAATAARHRLFARLVLSYPGGPIRLALP